MAVGPLDSMARLGSRDVLHPEEMRRDKAVPREVGEHRRFDSVERAPSRRARKSLGNVGVLRVQATTLCCASGNVDLGQSWRCRDRWVCWSSPPGRETVRESAGDGAPGRVQRQAGTGSNADKGDAEINGADARG